MAKTGEPHRIDRAVQDRLFAMEADLQLLAGLLLACRALGEVEDGVEPEAIDALARCSLATLERLRASWQGAVDAVTGGNSEARR